MGWANLSEEVAALFSELAPAHDLSAYDDIERARKALDMRNARAARRRPRGIEHNGERMTVAAWARRLGMKDSTIRHRFMLGWPLSRILAK